jgi:hypothetical protein
MTWVQFYPLLRDKKGIRHRDFCQRGRALEKRYARLGQTALRPGHIASGDGVAKHRVAPQGG